MPLIDFKVIREKQQIFKKEFIGSFRSSLEKTHNIATEIEAAAVEYGPIGYIAKTLIENSLGSAVSGVPIVGPFVADFVSTIPTQVYEYYQQKQQTSSSTIYNDYMAEIGIGLIESVIEETAHEIVRVFEYQIAMLKTSTDVQKLANFAVDKIFKVAKDNHGNFQFSRNDLLKILVTEDIVSNIEILSLKASQEQTLDTIADFKWQMRNVFTKPGLREEIDGGGYTYKVKIGSEEEKIKYGYRAKILSWDEIRKTFIHSELDDGFTQDSPTSSIEVDARSYAPSKRLVFQREVEFYQTAYLSQKHVSIEKTSFIECFNKINSYSSQAEVIPVFREVRFAAGSDLQNSDFSVCDMLRIFFTNANLQNSDFSNSYMALAEVTHSDLRGGSLKAADLRWSKFFAVNLQGNTILTQANFDYALLDRDTDLTDNQSFATAIIEKATILTDKVASTVLIQIEQSEEQLKLLQEDIHKQKKLQERIKALENSDVKFYNPRDVDERFVGREKVLNDLNIYYNEHKAGIQVIGGLGGMGKTQTALQYVHLHEEEYNYRVRWISASSEIALSLAFREFAESLGMVIEKETEEEILRWVKLKLAAKIEKSLLVFDNAESLAMIKKYLLDSDGTKKHHVLITTRNIKDWQDASRVLSSNVIEIMPFDYQTETLPYISKFVPAPLAEDAQALATTFDNIPLGLSQSLAFIKINQVTISSYLTEYRKLQQIQQQETLHDPKFEALREDGHKANIYITLTMVINSLSSSPKALEILRLCSFLDADAIPGYLFDSMFDSKIDQSRALSILKGYSLISIKEDHGTKMIYLHRLLQEVTRIDIGIGIDFVSFLFKAIKIVFSKTDCVMKTFENYIDAFKMNHEMLQHIEALILQYKQASQINEITLLSVKDSFQSDNSIVSSSNQVWITTTYNKFMFNQCGYLIVLLCHGSGISYFSIGKLNLALEKYEEYIDFAKKSYGDDHIVVAEGLNIVAKIFSTIGNKEKALIQYKESLRIKEIVYGKDHDSIAVTLRDIGNIYRLINKYNEALFYYLKALDIQKASGSENYNIMLTLYEIGGVYKELRKIEKCHASYNEALQIHNLYYESTENSYSFLHYITIGDIYKELNRIQEALLHYQKAFHIENTIYGENHISIAIIYSKIGEVYKKLDNHSESLVYYKKALEIMKNFYGSDHYGVAEKFDEIGDLYKILSNNGEALKCYEEALRIKELNFGNMHPSIAWTMDNIGSMYKMSGKYQEALNYYKIALKIKKTTLGSMHLGVSKTLQGIGDIYIELHSYQEALSYYKKALAIEIYISGEHNISLFVIFRKIGETYEKLGQYLNSIEEYEKSLSILQYQYGNNHFFVEVIICNIASLYEKLNDTERAIFYYNNSLEIRKNIYGNNDIKVAEQLCIIAELSNDFDIYREALSLYIREFSAKKESREIEDAITINEEIIFIYKKINQYENAVSSYEETLSLQNDFYGYQSTQVSNTLNSIGLIYKFYSDKKTKALEKFIEVLNIKKAIHGNLNVEVALSYKNVGDLYLSLEKYSEALQYYKEVLFIYENLFGRENEYVIKTLNNIGSVYVLWNQYQNALEYFAEELSIKRTIYGNEHTLIIKSLWSVALTYLELKKYQEALTQYFEIIRLKKLLGNGSSSLAESLQDIGNLYINIGEPQKAIDSYEEAIQLDSSNAFSIYHNLACMYHVQAEICKLNVDEESYKINLSRAEINFKKGVELNSNSGIYTEFANFLYQEQRYEEAIDYLLKAIELKNDQKGLSYGSLEKDTLPQDVQQEIDFHGRISLDAYIFACFLLINSYIRIGQMDRSKELIDEFQQEVNSNPKAISFSLLGYVYKALGKFELAVLSFERAAELYEPTEDHSEYTLALENQAICLSMVSSFGRENEAYVLTEQRSEIDDQEDTKEDRPPTQSEILTEIPNNKALLLRYKTDIEQLQNELQFIKVSNSDDDNPTVAEILLKIGKLFRIIEDYQQALISLQETQKIYSYLGGDYLQELAITIREVGISYYRLGNYEDALVQFHDALGIFQAIYDKNNIEIALTLRKLAIALREQGNYQESYTKFEESLSILKLIPENDQIIEIAVNLREFGKVHCLMNEYDDALAKYSEALDIFKANFGEEHYSVAHVTVEIGIVLLAQEKAQEAHDHFREALRINRKHYWNKHTTIAQNLYQIGKAYQALAHDYAEQNKQEQALDYNSRAVLYCEEALLIYNKVYGKDSHPQTAFILYTIGNLYYLMDKDVALIKLSQAASALKLFYDDNHSQVVEVLSKINEIEQLSSADKDKTKHKCIVCSVTNIEYENQLFNSPEVLQILQAAYEVGGTKAVDNLIDLGQNQELSSAIIDATKTYGARHVIDIIFGLREASLDTTSKKPDSQILMINENSQQIPEPSRAEFRPNNLMLPSLILKESIEALPTIKYFIKEVLHINYELPKFIDNNYFKLTAHFAAINIGAYSLIGKFSIVSSLLPTAIYGSKVLAYEYLSQQKHLNFQVQENKSIDSLLEFTQKCGFDIAAQTALGIVSSFISGNPLIYDMMISATIGGMQCYSQYNQRDMYSSNIQPIGEKVIPYIADTMTYYVAINNMQFDLSSTAGQMLAIKQGFTVLSSVVMSDYITKLAISSIPEGYFNCQENNMLGKMYSNFGWECNNDEV